MTPFGLALIGAAFFLFGALAADPPVTREVSRIPLVWLPPGEFEMGSLPGDDGRRPDETPHRVRLTRGFWLGATEVTQGQWLGVVGRNPSHFSKCGADCPVEGVSFEDARDFIARLNARSSGGFRLPTEAEWEYACRAGSSEPYSTGKKLDRSAANFDGPATVRVASFPPNAWGLFDMHGNVWEWCSDWYGQYGLSTAVDPGGPVRGDKRVIRGGSFHFGADSCRCALRYNHRPGDRGFSLGLRLALDAAGPE